MEELYTQGLTGRRGGGIFCRDHPDVLRAERTGYGLPQDDRAMELLERIGRAENSLRAADDLMEELQSLAGEAKAALREAKSELQEMGYCV